MHCETGEECPKVIRTPTLIYSVTVQQEPPDGMQPQDYLEVNWDTLDTLELKRFKETIVSYGMPSFFVRQILNSWEAMTGRI